MACWFNEERFIAEGVFNTSASLSEDGFLRVHGNDYISLNNGGWKIYLSIHLDEGTFNGKGEYQVNNRDGTDNRIGVRLIRNNSTSDHFVATESSGSGHGTVEIIEFDTSTTYGVISGTFDFQGFGRDPFGSGATIEFRVEEGRFDIDLRH